MTDHELQCRECGEWLGRECGEFQWVYVGGLGETQVFECQDCLDTTYRESTRAVELLQEKIKGKNKANL